ncbi:MAG: NADH-quinone oxidoreductase subunit NuoE [Candidatus Delongbacteria bacterium]|nr:NADH-quinone oxidoreductase subunit NuoE [Candidatus Delongbacteria bacterium]
MKPEEIRVDSGLIETYFEENPHLKSNHLIMVLQKVQEIYGYLPEAVLNLVSVKLRVPRAKIYGIATFYSQFRLTPLGKYVVQVCNGTACHVKGAPALIEELEGLLGIKNGETTSDGLFTLQTVNCIGACGLAPALVINEEIHGRVTSDRLNELINSIKAGER